MSHQIQQPSASQELVQNQAKPAIPSGKTKPNRPVIYAASMPMRAGNDSLFDDDEEDFIKMPIRKGSLDGKVKEAHDGSSTTVKLHSAHTAKPANPLTMNADKTTKTTLDPAPNSAEVSPSKKILSSFLLNLGLDNKKGGQDNASNQKQKDKRKSFNPFSSMRNGKSAINGPPKISGPVIISVPDNAMVNSALAQPQFIQQQKSSNHSNSLPQQNGPANASNTSSQ